MAHQPQDLDPICAIPMVNPDPIGIISQVAEWPTSKEFSGANPLLDEWVLLARALADLITYL
jgi:hypothetical protein